MTVGPIGYGPLVPAALTCDPTLPASNGRIAKGLRSGAPIPTLGRVKEPRSTEPERPKPTQPLSPECHMAVCTQITRSLRTSLRTPTAAHGPERLSLVDPT